MTNHKLLTTAILVVIAIAAVAGCAGTQTPSATPVAGSNMPANNTSLPGSTTPGRIPPGTPNGTMLTGTINGTMRLSL